MVYESHSNIANFTIVYTFANNTCCIKDRKINSRNIQASKMLFHSTLNIRKRIMSNDVHERNHFTSCFTKGANACKP